MALNDLAKECIGIWKMNSKKGDGKPFVPGTASSSKGKGGVEVPSPWVDQVTHGVTDISLGSPQDGEWEDVCARKSKTRAGSSPANFRGSQNPNPKAWGHPDSAQKLGIRNNGGQGKTPVNTRPTLPADSRRPAGRGNAMPQLGNRGHANNFMPPSPAIPPEHGRNWAAIVGSTYSMGSEDGRSIDETISNPEQNEVEEDDDDDALDDMEDTDDDLKSDEFDSDASQKSHETRKKNRWFVSFFKKLDQLTLEEINEPERQWHCPACHGGPGAIDWYHGLQPLITHAKTKGSKRVKLHREFAVLLDEELHMRGTSAIRSGEVYGKWKGLDNSVKDHEIVWPPMVMVMNTRLEQDENERWIGMGNQELLEYFSFYAAVKARHSYGPQGHRGMSVLIFENSATGYLEAERLDKHFQEQGTDRDAWDRRRVIFLPGGGGRRQLYGFLANKEDLDVFNHHSHGKMKLKFEMRSYQEMVVGPIKQMSEDNQQLNWYRSRVAKERRHAKVLEDTVGIMSDKLRKTMEENRIVRQRTKMQHEENKEEMSFQEEFFKEQMNIIHEASDAREARFEMMQQEERQKRLDDISVTIEDQKMRLEEVEKFIKSQDKEMADFVSERDELIKVHEDTKFEMKSRHLEAEFKLEEEFAVELSRLMEKYAPHGL